MLATDLEMQGKSEEDRDKVAMEKIDARWS